MFFEVPCELLKFGGNLNYSISFLTGILIMSNFLPFPKTLKSENDLQISAKASKMISEAPLCQIKQVKVQASLCGLKFMAYLYSTILFYAMRWKLIPKQVHDIII